MPVVRLYLAVQRVDLVQLDERGELPASNARPRTAYHVSAALQRAEPSLDVEALEYIAFCEAVAAAAANRPPSGGLVVVAADVDPAWLVATTPDAAHGSPCIVDLAEALPITRVASFHVGDDTSADRDDDLDAPELLWYDVTELPEVLSLLD